MPENINFDDLDYLLSTQDLSQNEPIADPPVRQIAPANHESSKKRCRLAERIADTDDLVRQVEQLKAIEKQLKDLQQTADEVTKLYQFEREQRVELEGRLSEQTHRCAKLDKDIDVQKLNCEHLEEQLRTKALPVDAAEMVSVFMQLSQRVDEDSHAIDLVRRTQKLKRKLKDYCKAANISIPMIRSPTSKRAKFSTATATQVTQTTQTMSNPLQDLPVTVPKMCSVSVQSENLVSTCDQGTQHKNPTTTRSTTTASFIKKHDVGTCFPEPKPALSAQQILDKMLSWNNAYCNPLSPISDPQPEPDVVQTACIGTCTDLLNVQREIGYLPELPAELKRSDSRPPSRASVKDELAMPLGGAASLGGYGHHMAKELLHFLPQSQSILTNLPPHVFEEIWQVMGQMVFVVLQRRSTNSSLCTPNPKMPSATINQADFGSWFDAFWESSINQPQSSNKDDAEFDVPSEEQITTDVGTDPVLPPPPEIGLELTPIRLPVKPKHRLVVKPKPKLIPKKKQRRVVRKSRVVVQRQEAVAPKATVPTETAVQFLSNLNMFKNPNCDITDIELDAEERQLLELTSASEKNEEPLVNHGEDSLQTKLLSKSDENLLQTPSHGDKEVTQQTKPSTLSSHEDQIRDESEEQSPRTILQKAATDAAQNTHLPPIEQVRMDSLKERVERFSEEEHKTSLKGAEVPVSTTSSTLSHKDQMKLLFDTDDESEESKDEEDLAQSSPSSFSRCIEDSIHKQNTPPESESDVFQSTATSTSLNEQNTLPSDSDGDLEEFAEEEMRLHINGNDSDEDSIDSHCLVIDDGNLQCDMRNDNKMDKEENAASDALLTLPVAKRKRKSSSSSLLDQQPLEKRRTRSQSKQMLLEATAYPESESLESVKETKESQLNCTISCSPMSPIAVASCEESDTEPIEIPLEQPGQQQSASEPKALLSYVVNEVKANAKQRGQRKQFINKLQSEQLKLKLISYLKKSTPLDSSFVQRIIGEATAAFDVIITAFGELQDESVPERLLALVRQIECENVSFIERFMNALEQRLFSVKERLSGQLAHKYLRLYLQLTSLQANLTVPGQSYVNPSRLMLAKILYHYNRDMSLLVLEVLCQFPTVLPHREERDYDQTDPLVTVIKHLLMSHKYEMHDAQGPDRALLSKLRFEYHFQPFEPTKQQVIDNLVEKLKAGRLNQLCYAFALFCRRSIALHVTKDVLEAQLLPLANSYCDLCSQDEAYDARTECLLQCVSMIVKQLPLDNKMDISNYIAIFKRLLVAVPRPGVQQAVVQAILRTQRFGYGFALEALHSYRPNYQLNPMTRAMMRSFAARRLQFQAHGQKIARNKQSIS